MTIDYQEFLMYNLVYYERGQMPTAAQIQDSDNETDFLGDTDEHDQDLEQSLEEFLSEVHQTSPSELEQAIPLSWLKSNFKTKSGAIRYLHQKGYNPKQIAQHLNIKYQHAYNVTHQTLKRGPNEAYDADVVWGCSHHKPKSHVDVILRSGARDPNQSRVLLRVCTKCALDLIPGVSEDRIKQHLPGGY